MIFELGPHSEDALAAAFAIYAAVIERSEQKAEAEFRALFARADYLIVLSRENGAVTGVSISFVPPDDDFWLLEYLAVDPACQGRGLGAALFEGTRARIGAARTALVEADAAFGPGIQRRRLGFYQRLTFRRVGAIPYQLPLTANGTPPPMILMAHTALNAIPRDTARIWLTRLYTDVYAQQPTDPRIAEMLANEPQLIPLATP